MITRSSGSWSIKSNWAHIRCYLFRCCPLCPPKLSRSIIQCRRAVKGVVLVNTLHVGKRPGEPTSRRAYTVLTFVILFSRALPLLVSRPLDQLEALAPRHQLCGARPQDAAGQPRPSRPLVALPCPAQASTGERGRGFRVSNQDYGAKSDHAPITSRYPTSQSSLRMHSTLMRRGPLGPVRPPGGEYKPSYGYMRVDVLLNTTRFV